MLQKCSLDRGGKPTGTTFVELGGGIHHHKEREQQRDEISIRNQPAVVVRAALDSSPAPHALAALALCARSCSTVDSGRKLRRDVRSMRGFIPSRMQITPSHTISRCRCSSR